MKEGLRELGRVEGNESRLSIATPGRARDKLFELAKELVHLNVDVIVAGPGAAALAAKQAATTIPIVMVAAVDHVGTGLVASLARPSANVTGLTFEVAHEQVAKTWNS